MLLAAMAAMPWLYTHGAENTPKHEVRAMWLTTIGGLDWPHCYAQGAHSIERQKQELRNILDRLKDAGINTVLLQTRIRATTIYPSALEPWDGCLSGRPGTAPGYDALKFAIDECHSRGMELHAWVVTIPVGKWNATGCKRLRKKMPRSIIRIADEGYMNPERAETADYLAKVCREIAEGYDIDGIHLDYIRYPETWRKHIDRNTGRLNITRIVTKITTAVKAIKPWVKMSCSPVGKFDDLPRYSSYGWNAYSKVCQDAQGWLQSGLMDQLYPMMYFRGNHFYPFALDWQQNSHGKTVAAGLGIYFLSPEEKDWSLDEIKRQMNVLRQYGLGHAYFRSKFFTDNTKGVYDFAKEFDSHPALIPPMTWQSSVRPFAPTTFHVVRTDSMTYLSWNGAINRSDAPGLLYNVYASTTWPVDVDDARNIIATRLTKQHIAIRRPETATALHYAVTAADRYGNESEPAGEPKPEQDGAGGAEKRTWLKNNGHTLQLPPKGQTLDADYIAIETLQGNIMRICPYSGTSAHIGSLPEGMYVLKSLGRKGVAHRLGHFIIKRDRKQTHAN